MLRTYVCPKCGEFEVYSRDTQIIKSCPKCYEPVKQKLGLNFKLKGSGFYSTDYAEVQ